jgi:hypothetical protein
MKDIVLTDKKLVGGCCFTMRIQLEIDKRWFTRRETVQYFCSHSGLSHHTDYHNQFLTNPSTKYHKSRIFLEGRETKTGILNENY